MNRILMLSTGGTLASSHSANGLAPGLHGGGDPNRISGLTAGFTVVEEELFMLEQPEHAAGKLERDCGAHLRTEKRV